MKNFETITYELNNHVATISLNRPKALNAMSQTMRKELKQVIDSVEADSEVRIVVIRAEGRGFSSGTDLTEGLAGFDTIEDQIVEEYRPVLMGIAESSKPYIASIHGACTGVGAGLAMSCDLAVMADDSFLYLAFAAIALVPDGGMAHHLVCAMGYKKAYQAFIEAARLKPDECLEYGLVNKVVEASQLEEVTNAWALRLAEGAPLAQKLGKKILRGVHTSSLDETLRLEAKHQVTCSTSKDSLSAINAFFKKTKPVFVGE